MTIRNGRYIPDTTDEVMTVLMNNAREVFGEDLNDDENVANDDTDEDLYPNYIDADDDGDFIPTREEIIIDEETGEITFPDSDNDGTPDYLDGDV